VSPALRVLHISAGNLYGGVESLLVTLARHRRLCPEMEPHFGCCFDGRLTEELRACGAPVHDLGAVRARRPWTVWLARRRLRRLLRSEAFDVVVCHAAWAQAVFGPAIRAERTPLVFWLHGAAGGQHWLERWARRTAPDLAICPSRFTAGQLPALYPHVRVEVVHCPVPAPPGGASAEQRHAIRHDLGTPADAVVLLQASRMEALKGHALLLDALTHVRVPGWMLWIAGGAQRPEEVTYQDHLQALAEAKGIADRVRFLGQRADVPRLMAAADVYCQANTGPEGFGIAFVEALYAGLPVVTTALGAAPEIVDPTCGILVPPAADTLADALATLIADPALRRRLGEMGPGRARHLCDTGELLRRLADALTSVTCRAVAV
jgi:glycosyltransferase involved in cell wall biosynthesis